MELDEAAHTLRIGETTLHEGSHLTLDGNDGVVYAGPLHTTTEPPVDLQDRLARLRKTEGKAARLVKVERTARRTKAVASWVL